jgi:two-component SAPR family response regulator
MARMLFPASEDAVSVRTFGAFELAFEGVAVEQWRAGKARNLLQFLLLHRGRTVSRDTLREALWPSTPWSRDSSSLKVAVHMLRKVLDSAPAGPGAPVLRLVTSEPGYRLDAERIGIDYETFGRLADAADAAAAAAQRGDTAAASTLYRRAADLYRDDFLPDVPYDWAATQRTWLRGRLLHGLGFLIEDGVGRGEHAGVMEWCRRMLDAEPLHEDSYRALILVHGQLGQVEQADRWFRLCAHRLRDRLQVAPDPVTCRAHTGALRGELTGRAIDPLAWRPKLRPAPALPSTA